MMNWIKHCLFNVSASTDEQNNKKIQSGKNVNNYILIILGIIGIALMLFGSGLGREQNVDNNTVLVSNESNDKKDHKEFDYTSKLKNELEKRNH